MTDDPDASRADKPPTSHTREHVTADEETGDEAPEVEENLPPRRRILEDAADEVEANDDQAGR